MKTPIASGFKQTPSRSLSDVEWQLVATSAAQFDSPVPLLQQAPRWQRAVVPGTVAQSLALPLHSSIALDKQDWWYHGQFCAENNSVYSQLCFDGLATYAEVWLNGEKILRSDNMFRAYQCDIASLLREQNELFICFRALDTMISERKARPRWKTALIAQQNMRWVRTTLLGRVSAWMPTLAPIGPWREIKLISTAFLQLEQLSLRTEVCGDKKILRVVTSLKSQKTDYAALRARVVVGERSFPLSIAAGADHLVIEQAITLDDAPLWWPHTHGEPSRLRCQLVFDDGHQQMAIDAGFVAFKSVAIDRNADHIKFIVNGSELFIRGACWTVNDIVSLNGDYDALRQALSLAQQAGINMLRVGGTMIYESDAFYDLCDEFGILVWQDFMFANMDYPFADEAFHVNVTAEIDHQLNRLQKHVCLAVYCGGSEVKQQAAMLGLAASEWNSDFFDRELPLLCQQRHPDIPYFPSSPCEGALPFHINKGIGHYYGVGAFRRPLNDVKLANVKFASECLGFSNVPESVTAELLGDSLAPPPHDPRWKARVPRDPRAGLDFEDVRDHYLNELFGIDPIQLRSQDIDRYYAISRVVSGEVMHRVFAHWRQSNSQCGGGLVWFYKDLWPGAGWGLIDSLNRPKAAYHYLRRSFAAQVIFISDEGCNGLQLHLINEQDQPLDLVVGFEALQRGHIVIAQAQQNLTLDAREQCSLSADAMLGYFSDLSYAFKFGPAKHDVVRAYMKCAKTAKLIGEDYFFPVGMNLACYEQVDVQASAQFLTATSVQLTLSSDRFLQSVHIDANGYTASDDYFHLAPGQQKIVLFIAAKSGAVSFKGEVTALNLRDSIMVRANFTASQ